ELHVRPGIGALALRELNIQRLDKFLMNLAAGHPTEAKRAKTIIRGALKLAASYGAAQIDLSALFVVPRKHLEVRALKQVDIDAVFHAIDTWRTGLGRRGPRPTRHLGDAFRIMLGAGLRIGEVLALRKCDIHPGGEDKPWKLEVNGTIIVPDHGKTFRQPHPKTPAGVRTLPLPAFVGEVLAARLELIADAGPEALLFYSRNNTPLQPGNLRRTWRTIRDATEGLDFVIPHTLRKTLATLLADSDPYYAAAFLGHGPGTAVLFAHYVERNRNLNPAGAAPLEGLAPN
ncbi:MAG: tyrosine-type recombinase/integrase, partial [Terrimesophilobacter sp.]